jgi:hypothetical protein
MFWSDEINNPIVADTLRWLTDTGLHWNSERLQWDSIDINATGIQTSYDRIEVMTLKIPNLRRQTRPHRDAMHKVEYNFTRAIGILEWEDSRNIGAPEIDILLKLEIETLAGGEDSTDQSSEELSEDDEGTYAVDQGIESEKLNRRLPNDKSPPVKQPNS